MLAIGDNKRCSHCKIWKPLSDFHVSRREPDGHKGECKECRHEYESRPEVRKHRSKMRRRRISAIPQVRKTVLKEPVLRDNKQCGHCKILKPLSDFHCSVYEPDGHKRECKPCRSEARRRLHRKKLAELKCCTGCKKIKPKSAFGLRSKSPDGLSYQCKQCQSEYRAKPEVKAHKRDTKRLLNSKFNPVQSGPIQGTVSMQSSITQTGEINPRQEAALRRHARNRWMQELLGKFGVEV